MILRKYLKNREVPHSQVYVELFELSSRFFPVGPE